MFYNHRESTMRRLSISFLFMLFVVFWACNESTDTTDNASEYVGVLVDNTNAPVSGAIVSIYNSDEESPIETDTSDALGIFILKKMPTDTSNLNIKAEHSNFQPIKMKFHDLFEKCGKDKKKLKINFDNPDSCCGRIYMTIYNSADSTAINKCEVKLRHNTSTVRVGKTNEAGKIEFLNVCPGEYNIRIANEHYNVIEDNLIISNCDSLGFKYYMTPKQTGNDSCCNGTAIIYILNGENSGVANATVKLWKNAVLISAAPTGTNGRVQFNNLCPGNYGVSYMKEGWQSAEFNFEIGCNGIYEIHKNMIQTDTCCKGIIRIFPKDSATNTALNGATVKIWKNGNLIGTKTVAEGMAKFENLCEGTYGFDIIAENHKSIEFQVTIECNQNKEVVKQIPQTTCCNNRYKLFVKDSLTEAILTNATVKLWQGSTVKYNKSTEANGYVVFEGICQGNYVVTVQREGYQAREYQIEFSCDNNIERTVKLLPTATDSCCTAKLRLTIKNAEGTAQSGVEVKVRLNGEQLQVKQTNAEGFVGFEGLCAPRTYNIRIYKEGYAVQEINYTYTQCNTKNENITLVAAQKKK